MGLILLYVVTKEIKYEYSQLLLLSTPTEFIITSSSKKKTETQYSIRLLVFEL